MGIKTFAPSPPARHIGRCVLAFSLSLGAGLALAEAALPPWGNEVERAKLAHFLEHRDEYDTLFVGSSTIHSGFDPEQFDRENAAAGHPTKTFNFGSPGAHTFSHEHLLERILASRPAQLRWVLVQSEGVHESTLANWEVFTPSMVAWHDWRGTREVCELFEQQGVDDLQQLKLDHWAAFALRVFRASRGRPWVDRALGLTEPTRAMGPEHDGFMPLVATDSPRLAYRSARFLETQQGYVEILHAWMDSAPRDTTAPPVLLRKLEHMQARCADAGVRLVFVTLAGAHSGSPAVAAHQAGRIDDLLRYDDVREYAPLFHPANRFDRSHFNPEGASLFTLALAEGFQLIARAAR